MLILGDLKSLLDLREARASCLSNLSLEGPRSGRKILTRNLKLLET